MTTNLWSFNLPQNFWLCQPNPSEELWQEAIRKSIPILELGEESSDIESVLAWTLGEGRFGPDHWDLGILMKTYYMVKFILPRIITRLMRRQYYHGIQIHKNWPIESRYVRFLWEILRQILLLSDNKELTIKSFWPEHKQFAFILTHDIETTVGQDFVTAVADLEEKLGFRSSFNFVPERYKINHKLMDDLKQRGFEVGVQGLKHNGRLFNSKHVFKKNADQINKYLKEWKAVGFRAELTHRHPEWMQMLDVEYDLSFFDTDPFEPIPGGTMSIWPFFIGHFVELPYTLVQDYTLTTILGEKTPHIWLDKVDFLKKYHGMALVNSHPDYLKVKSNWKVYADFLNTMKMNAGYWHGLPIEASNWWKLRTTPTYEVNLSSGHFSRVRLNGDNIQIEA